MQFLDEYNQYLIFQDSLVLAFQDSRYLASESPEGFFFFLMGCGLNSGLHTCRAGALPLEPHIQSILLWLFGDRVSRTIFSFWPSTTILLISASQVVGITA
jgi:hypothetical protein